MILSKWLEEEYEKRRPPYTKISGDVISMTYEGGFLQAYGILKPIMDEMIHALETIYADGSYKDIASEIAKDTLDSVKERLNDK